MNAKRNADERRSTRGQKGECQTVSHQPCQLSFRAQERAISVKAKPPSAVTDFLSIAATGRRPMTARRRVAQSKDHPFGHEPDSTHRFRNGWIA